MPRPLRGGRTKGRDGGREGGRKEGKKEWKEIMKEGGKGGRDDTILLLIEFIVAEMTYYM